jgi:hypothetical protein
LWWLRRRCWERAQSDAKGRHCAGNLYSHFDGNFWLVEPQHPVDTDSGVAGEK